MASSHKNKTSQRPPKTNWFLSCFGVHRKPPAADKKAPKSGGRRRRWFRICLPKIKIISFKKRSKVSFHKKAAAIKGATKGLMLLEASKVHKLKLHDHINHPLIIRNEEPKGIISKEVILDHLDIDSSRIDESDDNTCHKQGFKSKPKDKGRHRFAPYNKAKKCLLASKVTKDSLIGASIMVLTLIIMSIWGRLCAILCMSAWLYCVPLLREARKMNFESHENSKQLKMSSELYNKKVVLEGLLQRNHRINAKTGFKPRHINIEDMIA